MSQKKPGIGRLVNKTLDAVRAAIEAGTFGKRPRRRAPRRSPIPESPGKGSIFEAQRIEAEAAQCEKQGLTERAAILRADAAEHRRLAREPR
jgi:hypothetical protein